MKTLNLRKALRVISFALLASVAVVSMSACGKKDKNNRTSGIYNPYYPGQPGTPGYPGGPGTPGNCGAAYCAVDGEPPEIVMGVNPYGGGANVQGFLGIYPTSPYTFYGCPGFSQAGPGTQVSFAGNLNSGIQVGPLFIQGVILANTGRLSVTVSDGYCSFNLY